MIPTFILRVATDARAWLVLGAALVLLALWNADRRNDALEAEIATAGIQADAQTDGASAADHRQRQQTTRRAQAARIDTAIHAAPDGGAHDAALDAIAAERPAHHGTTDEALPVAPARRPMPRLDGDSLRKPSDVVVVP